MTHNADMDEPVTRAQYKKLAKYVKREFKRINDQLEDLWTRVNDVDNNAAQLEDEALQIANRARRMAKRTQDALSKHIEEDHDGSEDG